MGDMFILRLFFQPAFHLTLPTQVPRPQGKNVNEPPLTPASTSPSGRTSRFAPIDGGPTPRTAGTVVLYDGGCPLCRREIAHYRRCRTIGSVDWIDLATLPRETRILGIDRSAAMARFHVRDAQGHWHTGAFAFIALWSRLRGYRILARIVCACHLPPLLERVYVAFARRRHALRCSDARCASSTESPT